MSAPLHAPPIPVRLTKIEYAARDTNLYTFERLDGGLLPGAAPGAHIGLHLPNAVERQYSLVESGTELKRYVIGVKRDQASRGGSAYLHERLRVGAVVDIDPPRNNFPLREDAEISVLIAGGIGVTPIWSMVRRLTELGREWRLFYSARSREDAAFAEALAVQPRAALHFDDEAGTLLPLAEIVTAAPEGAHLYCCGPAPMLKAFEDACRERASETVHVEYFTPRFEAAEEGGFTVALARSGREFAIPAGKSILKVLQEAGVPVTSSCEEGVCAACETRVLEGIPDHRDAILSEAERAANETMFICCSGARSERLVLDL